MTHTLTIEAPAAAPHPAGRWEALCRALLYKKLSGLARGRVEVAEGAALAAFGEARPDFPVRARITVRRPRFFTRALLGGSTGAAESFADGDWDCDDLAALCRIFTANRDALTRLDGGWGALFRPVERLVHWTRRNTVGRARENIRAHYDLGNDFFALFLDETWMYSSAIFPREDSPLAEASTAKLDRVCRKLRLTPRDRVLEIGTGWGGFALHAAENYGCRVTTTTISRAQHDLARERVRAAGLEGRVEILLEDYRDLKGRYDKLVSIEMIEAVGLDRLGEYFRACGERLEPDGLMLLQSILIRDQNYEDAKRSVDFIQKHIFPGSGIPSVRAIVGAVAERTDMVLAHHEDLTAHYVRTLRHWNARLADNRERMVALGYPERLYRLWRFYFGYCEGGFRERAIGVAQMMFAKPENRAEPLLGAL